MHAFLEPTKEAIIELEDQYMGTYMTYIYIVYTYILTQINMYTHSRISRADEEVIIELDDQ